MTREEALSLKPGQILVNIRVKNKKGEFQRWKVNGKVKTWKRRPQCFKIPIKHGLYSYDYLTEEDFQAGFCDFMRIES